MFPAVEKPPSRFAALLRGDHPRFPSSYVREVGLEFVRGEWQGWCASGWINTGQVTCMELSSERPWEDFANRLQRDYRFGKANAVYIARQLCAHVDQQLLAAGFDLASPGGLVVH